MSDYFAARRSRTVVLWIAMASLLLSIVVPMLVTTTAQAAQLTSRAVHVSDSVAGATDVNYEVEFVVPTTGNIGVIALQYCDDSPIIGDSTCADARSFDWNDAALAISAVDITTTTGTTGDCGGGNFAVDAASSDSNGLLLTRAPASASAGCIMTFQLGAGGGSDGVTNPTGANSAFYIRIHTYAGALSTVPCTTGGTCDSGSDFDFDNASLGNVDDGGVALSTASQLTINARVQEVLTFTVGTDAAADDCAVLAGDTIDIGALTTAGINLASTDPSTDTNVGCGEVTTNAANGVQIFYVGDDMKVGSATCTGSTDDDGGSASDTDLCLNVDSDADNGTSTAISAGDEQWGIGVSNLGSNAGSNVTSNLSTVAAYDIDTAGEYSFVPNTATEFVSSTTVVNTETFELDAAATPSITTPTGLYSTTLTFIATATF